MMYNMSKTQIIYFDRLFTFLLLTEHKTQSSMKLRSVIENNVPKCNMNLMSQQAMTILVWILFGRGAGETNWHSGDLISLIQQHV